MKTTTIWQRIVTVIVLALCLVVAALIVARNRVAAFNPQPDPPALGMIGITSEQTARLNVVRLDPIPAGDRPVQVELIFFDAQGNLLEHSTETLMPGQAAFLDLDGATILPTSDGAARAEIRGEVRMDPIPIGDLVATRLVPTLEVFDNSGIDAGKSRMGWSSNHNETIVRERPRTRRWRR